MLSPGEKPKGTLQQKIEDKKRLEAMKARMAALPPDQRKRVANRALAMSYQRRAGIKPTYLLTRLEATGKSSVGPGVQIT